MELHYLRSRSSITACRGPLSVYLGAVVVVRCTLVPACLQHWFNSRTYGSSCPDRLYNAGTHIVNKVAVVGEPINKCLRHIAGTGGSRVTNHRREPVLTRDNNEAALVLRCKKIVLRIRFPNTIPAHTLRRSRGRRKEKFGPYLLWKSLPE